jgi:hypothetical protein
LFPTSMITMLLSAWSRSSCRVGTVLARQPPQLRTRMRLALTQWIGPWPEIGGYHCHRHGTGRGIIGRTPFRPGSVCAHETRLGTHLEPPFDVLVCQVLGNVVHKECADSSTVVRAGDGAVSLLPRCTHARWCTLRVRITGTSDRSSPPTPQPERQTEGESLASNVRGWKKGRVPVSQICALIVLPST